MRCLKCRQDGIALDILTCPKCGVYIPTLMRDMLAPGTLLQGGNYRVDYALGQGGFGITYRAFDLNLERPVAIKEFYPQDYVQREGATGQLRISASERDVYERWLQRFEREGRILARLTHPGIVKVYYLFKERETAYLVMELLQGGTLGDELLVNKGKGLPQERVVQVMTALVEALDTVHQEGVYHLDLKPDNVMVTKEGRIVLVDFGAARQDLGGQSKKSTSAYTMEYAPPELISGESVNAATDLFELGMMLHEMLTGQRPKSALDRFMRDDWSPVGLPEPWTGLVSAAIQLRPQDRPQTVREWWQRYHEFEDRTPLVSPDPPPQPPKRINRRVMLLGGLGVVGLGGTWLLSQLKPIRTFSFEVVTVNETGEIISREQKSAVYFTEELGNGVILDMVEIPAGEFLMGSPVSEVGHESDESPQRRVNVPRFFMGRFEVTQAQWQAVMGDNPSYFKGENRPVDQVSWNDSQAFCKKLSQKTGKKYRLPSEAEWEYACRAGTTTTFHFGPTITPDLVNFNGNYPYASASKGKYRGETTPVGSFLANEFGLYDMHGNVREWCEDVHHANYNGAPTDGSAWVSGGDSTQRLERGGSWADYSRGCRSSSRYDDKPEDRSVIFGFRVVCEPPGL